MVFKKNSTSYRLMLFLATLIAFSEACGDLFKCPYNLIYGYWPKEHNAFRLALHRLSSVGNIETATKDGQRFLTITSQGVKNLKKQIPLARFKTQKWDGQWLMVVFDISEKERAKRRWLRDKINELNFAQFQKSVYLSPFKLKEEIGNFLETKGLSNEVAVFETSSIFGKSDRQLAQELWRLEVLNNDS